MKISTTLTLATLGLVSLLGNPVLADDGSDSYRVTITNLTRGQSITPMLVASHKPGIRLFELGAPASDALAAMAEGGDTSGLLAELQASGRLIDSASSGGLLGPGESVTVHIASKSRSDRISVAGMMLPTNDGFISLNAVAAPGKGSVSYNSPAYDAGSEHNDELCAHIPGPHCGGEPFSAGLAEGVVHIHAGIHGGGDLDPAERDWRNPVVRVVIKRIDD